MNSWPRRPTSSGVRSLDVGRDLPQMSERILHLAEAVAPELVRGGHGDVAPASAAVWIASSTSSTYMKSPIELPPSSFGDLVVNCGNASASMTTESPISSSQWAIVPPGPSIRERSFAPKARL